MDAAKWSAKILHSQKELVVNDYIVRGQTGWVAGSPDTLLTGHPTAFGSFMRIGYGASPEVDRLAVEDYKITKDAEEGLCGVGEAKSDTGGSKPDAAKNTTQPQTTQMARKPGASLAKLGL